MSGIPRELTRAEIEEAIRKAGSRVGAARLLTDQGNPISERTIRRRLNEGVVPKTSKTPFEVLNPAPPAIDPQLLIEERRHKFGLLKANYDANRIVKVKVNIDGPIGLGWFGDPHVDDDGTDIGKLFDHADIFDGRNEGLFGCCIGDLRNNWIGRLARLWSEQSTSAEEAKVLAEAFIRKIQWLIFVKGNHDAWVGSDDILDWLLKDAIVQQATRTEVHLHFPNGKVVEIYAAHDFKGRSQWSASFGAAKKAQMHRGSRIYICGHLHDAAYQHGFHPDKRMWHAVRMASYKKVDEYVDELGLEPSPGYECPVSIIDPYATEEVNLIRWEWTPDAGADRLKWLRNKS